ncbi:hypothetical protein IM793_23645 [Pedobacter sp. MR2016-19]|uniref:hypothetical protein n=1 Tax=Pedobacter sp. MR2016-19 TaxID=2780089 RepID=UPI0018768400|nr:hypothetical protein [Pedobacter sp. MR2016-19]MBE5322167.1 hypothetical protein [Pedobacter sp. MR2016-19]
MSGFYIKSLHVKGNNVETASINFEKGANLVTGASDTGKSYIFAALSYALGIGEAPKDIPQSVGYNELLIEIVTYKDNKTYTLWRELHKTIMYVKECTYQQFYTKSITKFKLTTTGQLDNPEHISSFLLELIELKDKRILVNKKSGATANIAFRNLLNLTFIAEENIIKTTSPFYSSGPYYKERIMAQSLLHVLLSGNDFSDIVEKEDTTIKENQILGKLEFLEYQVKQYSLDKALLVEKTTSSNFIGEKQKFLELDSNLQNNIALAKELVNRKNKLLQDRQNLINELVYKKELTQRFSILEKQYVSDSERLDFILETHVISEQLGDVVCPLCSSPLQDDHIYHIKEKENFIAAATNELSKIQSKLLGLKDTADNLAFEEITLQIEVERLNNQLNELEIDLESNFSVKTRELKNELNEYLEIENTAREIVFIDNQITKLLKEKDRLENLLNAKKPAEEEINLVPYSLLTDLCWFIEKRLQNWNYENSVKIDFDSHYNTFDIVISGKTRKSYGKGKRSISYAACLIGLLDYCQSNTRNFSNLIVLDSPLTTYEEKQKGTTTTESIQTEILKSFFIDIIALPNNSQVILFDNKTPDSDTLSAIQDKLHLVTFTGTKGSGRQGFFPE